MNCVADAIACRAHQSALQQVPCPAPSGRQPSDVSAGLRRCRRWASLESRHAAIGDRSHDLALTVFGDGQREDAFCVGWLRLRPACGVSIVSLCVMRPLGVDLTIVEEVDPGERIRLSIPGRVSRGLMSLRRAEAGRAPLPRLKRFSVPVLWSVACWSDQKAAGNVPAQRRAGGPRAPRRDSAWAVKSRGLIQVLFSKYLPGVLCTCRLWLTGKGLLSLPRKL
jgi:hypothetical protein